jgi:hypothetical protein
VAFSPVIDPVVTGSHRQAATTLARDWSIACELGPNASSDAQENVGELSCIAELRIISNSNVPSGGAANMER